MLHKLGFHWYKVVKDTAITQYKECSCGKRTVRQVLPEYAGYQPINWKWVSGKTDSLDVNPTPPEGGSVLYRDKEAVPKTGTKLTLERIHQNFMSLNGEWYEEITPKGYNPRESQSGPWPPYISRADKLRSEKELTIPVKYNPLHPAHNHGKR